MFKSIIRPLAVALSLAIAAPLVSAAPALAAPRDHRTVVKQTTNHRHGKTVTRTVIKDKRGGHARDRNWHRRGGHVPASYRGRFVSDWSHRGLRRPPHGQRWVHVDNDYVLISTATGIIASIVAASR